MLISKPRAVLLDAGFTLTFLDGERIARLANTAGAATTAAAIEAAESLLRREVVRAAQAIPLPGTPGVLRADAAPFYRRLLELAGAQQTPAVLTAAADGLLAAHLEDNLWSRIGPGVDDALVRLRAVGIRLAVVSNSEGTVAAMLRKVGLARHLELIVDSHVVGVEKPDPRIFKLALDHLGIAAGDAIMVGDTPSADVVGAQAAGIAAALLDPLDLYPDTNVPRFTDLAAFVNALLADR